jgi:DNA-binding PadR family transcriptional regulator
MPAKSRLSTNAELAVLCLLAEQPMHGYQIEQTIESRGMREWTEIGFSSIYYLLDKLRSRGCMESRLEQVAGKGPARQVFSLTPTGFEIFRQAALNALASPVHTFSNFQIGLAALPMFHKEEILSSLRSYQSMLKDKLAELTKKSSSYGVSLPWHIAAMFDLDLAQLHCELGWLEKFISAVEHHGG